MVMVRLPHPGKGEGTWGKLLNSFLLVSHNEDGTLKIADIVASKCTKPAGGIPKTDLSSDVQIALDSAVSGVAPDATTTQKA